MPAIQKQLPLRLHRRGGKRPGAGRKPKGDEAGMPHRSRPALASRYPVHVTLRVQPRVWNLRGRQCFRVIARAFAAAHRRAAFRLNEVSVQGNHLHLIVEANDAKALARGLQSLEIRIAKGLNTAMGTRGAVFADRYHAHILRTPTEVANALGYVRGNFAIHAERIGARPLHPIDRCSSAALVDGASPEDPRQRLVAPPRSWLLSVGWRRALRRRHDPAGLGRTSY
jgi:REP element-mobilizing transposase RayT